MDAFRVLRKQAAAKRDAAIQAARDEYKSTLAGIDRIAKTLNGSRQSPPESRAVRSKPNRTFVDMTAIEAAEAVLREGEPLRLTELTLKVQALGCRAGDNPRTVAHSIRSSMLYHECRFKKDAAGKWFVV
jgi:hypothetical protein